MPIYTYRAVNAQGSSVAGEIVANDVEAARLSLQGRGLLAQRVARQWLSQGSGQRQAQWLLFIQSFQALLQAGLEAVEAMDIAGRRVSAPWLKSALVRAQDLVRSGKSLSDAFSADAPLYGSLWVAALRAGEASGRLPEAVTAYEEHLARMAELRRKILSALTYPALLTVMMLVVVMAIMIFVIPRLTAGFASLGSELPLLTRALVSVSHNLPWVVLVVLGLVLAARMVWRRLVSPVHRAEQLDRCMAAMPLVGGLREELRTVNIATTLSLLISAGNAFPVALRMMADTERNASLAFRLGASADAISSGQSVTSAFTRYNILPEAAMQILEAGDRSGQLGVMLDRIARYYRSHLDISLQRFVSLSEPLLMLVMGLVIGLVVVAVYLPVFAMTQVLA